MTQQEFAKGWKLLILQPWGRNYRTLTDEGQLTEESKTQMDFYYSRLKFGHPDAWMKVAQLYAEGEHWPSLSAVRQTLSDMNGRYVRALTDQTKLVDRVTMPEEIRKKLQEDGILKTMPDAHDEEESTR